MKKLLLILLLPLLSRAESPAINLHLEKINFSKKYRDDNSIVGPAMLLGGLILSAAVLAETDLSYTKYQNTSGSRTLTSPPFIEQTPRQIFFFGGLVMSGVGLAITIGNR